MNEIVVKSKSTKLAGVCGVLASLVIFTSILLAIFWAPWFKWTNNALSDLGVDGISAFFFNNGMIVGGILIFIFSIGLAKILTNRRGCYFLAVSSLALIGVGLFPEYVFILHYIVSVIFFVLLALSLLILGVTIKKEKYEHNMGITACVLSVIAFSSVFLLGFFNGIAIPEALACFPAFIWFTTYGIKMAV